MLEGIRKIAPNVDINKAFKRTSYDTYLKGASLLPGVEEGKFNNMVSAAFGSVPDNVKGIFEQL
jgi:hypothetical protein